MQLFFYTPVFVLLVFILKDAVCTGFLQKYFSWRPTANDFAGPRSNSTSPFVGHKQRKSRTVQVIKRLTFSKKITGRWLRWIYVQ